MESLTPGRIRTRSLLNLGSSRRKLPLESLRPPANPFGSRTTESLVPRRIRTRLLSNLGTRQPTLVLKSSRNSPHLRNPTIPALDVPIPSTSSACDACAIDESRYTRGLEWARDDCF